MLPKKRCTYLAMSYFIPYHLLPVFLSTLYKCIFREIINMLCIVNVNKDVHNYQTRLLKIGKGVSDVPVSITFYQNIMRQLYASICLSKVQFGVSNKKDESEKK